jgi:hypothetical protein
MAKRLTDKDIQRRVLELESLFGQKKLSEILGVSADSVRRYREGKSKPTNKNVKEKINRLYNTRKNIIVPEKVKKLEEQIKHRKIGAKEGRKDARFAPIYPDYMYDSPANEFSDVRNFDKMEELNEAGYVVGWYGRSSIPLEVQFVIHGESLERWGKVIHVIGIVNNQISPKEENAYTGLDTSLQIYKAYFRLIPGLKKRDDFDTRMEKIRNWFIDLKVEKGFTVALLGYYFDEFDEI